MRKINHRKIDHRTFDWSVVDWEMSTTAIARLHKVGRPRVGAKRRELQLQRVVIGEDGTSHDLRQVYALKITGALDAWQVNVYDADH